MIFKRYIFLFIISVIFVAPVTAQSGEFVKQKIPLSDGDMAIVDYKKALKLLDVGEDVAASQVLQNIVEQYPSFNPARLELIKLYKKIGWNTEVNNLLKDGLRIDDDNPRYILQMVKSMLDSKKSEEALSLLLTVPNTDQNTIEYRAMLARVYFDLELYDLSNRSYAHLLRRDIQNPKWWLGQAINLEAIGDYQGALNSFNKVQSIGKVSPEVLQYVDSRINYILNVVGK